MTTYQGALDQLRAQPADAPEVAALSLQPPAVPKWISSQELAVIQADPVLAIGQLASLADGEQVVRFAVDPDAKEGATVYRGVIASTAYRELPGHDPLPAERGVNVYFTPAPGLAGWVRDHIGRPSVRMVVNL